MASFLLFGLLFLLPFIVSPLGALYFEPPKVIVAEVLIELLVIFLLLKGHLEVRKKVDKKHLLIVCLFFLLSLIGLIINYSSSHFFGNIFRLQGVLLFWHLLLFSLLVPFLDLPKVKGSIYFFLLVFLFLATLVLGKGPSARFIGPLGEPNALAAVAIWVFGFVLFHSPRLLKAIGLLLALAIIVFSGSRSGVIALFLQVLLFILNKKAKIPLKVSFPVCLIVFLISFSLPFIEGGDWFENRSEVWQTAFLSGFASPIIGSGFGNIQASLHNSSLLLGNNIQYQVVDSSHNFLLDYWVQGGLMAVVLMISLLYLSINNMIKRHQLEELILFLGIMTVMSFNPVSVITLIAFWYLIGRSFSKD